MRQLQGKASRLFGDPIYYVYEKIIKTDWRLIACFDTAKECNDYIRFNKEKK
jgi:hypothetical protein